MVSDDQHGIQGTAATHTWFLYFTPVLLIYCFVGFYPFSWHSPVTFHINSAQLIHGERLNIAEQGIAYTYDAPGWLKTAIQSASLQVAVKIRTTNKLQSGPARIFTISKDPLERNLTLGQDGSDLVIRVRRPGSTANGMPAYKVGDVFSSVEWHRIVLLIRSDHLTLSINGNIRLSEPLPANTFSEWLAYYRVAFANELTYDRPWSGEIEEARITVPGATIDYLNTPELLSLPCIYMTKKRLRNLQLVPFADDYEYVENPDFWINLLGFVPLGILFVWLHKTRYVVIKATLFCAVVSTFIEAAQLFFIDRNTSINDLILNILGGALGATIGMLFFRYRSYIVPGSLGRSHRDQR